MRPCSISRLVVALMSLGLAGGCTPKAPPESVPHFNPGEGAISGELLDADHQPFDLELAGGAKNLEIELLSPVLGVAGTTHPYDAKSHFVFSHLAPGKYELNAHVTVTGKREIDVNGPVTVDPDKVTPVKLTLTVKDTSAAN